jgi:hypothetical protein
MPHHSLLIAAISLMLISCGDNSLLSSRESWGGDFADRSPPTDACPGGTLSQLHTQMNVSVPLALADAEVDMPDALRSRIKDGDAFRTFEFDTDLNSSAYWRFSGYLIARGDCIVHAETTGYDN